MLSEFHEAEMRSTAEFRFNIDMERCPNCQGRLTIIAAIEDPSTIAKILKHLGLPARAPPRAPAKNPVFYEFTEFA